MTARSLLRGRNKLTRELIQNLEKEGLISPSTSGFYSLTAEGEFWLKNYYLEKEKLTLAMEAGAKAGVLCGQFNAVVGKNECP